jgi:hypothetical protein
VEQSFSVVPGISGAWYDPTQSGHGFYIEVLGGASNLAQTAWFTFDNNGAPAWITAEGEISGGGIHMNALLVTGGRFPPYFDSNSVKREDWGTLDFQFTDCTHGTVTWSTRHLGFTSFGLMNLQRLSQIAGTTCP